MDTSSKRCFKCLCVKPLDDFYKHTQMADGRLNKCKECTKSDVTKHRQENLERVRAYDRMRSSMPHRVAAKKEYMKTEAGKASKRRSIKAYQARRPERRAAHVKLCNAVRDGKVIPWPVCAVPDCDCRPEAHHADYSRPLDVVWLCRSHHRAVHQMHEELEAA